jgi:hypothetical protein
MTRQETGFSPLGSGLEACRRAPAVAQSRVSQRLSEREALERALRKLSGREGGMSAASRALGVHHNTVGRILKMGLRIGDELIAKLASQLGVSTDDLKAGRF